MNIKALIEKLNLPKKEDLLHDRFIVLEDPKSYWIDTVDLNNFNDMPIGGFDAYDILKMEYVRADFYIAFLNYTEPYLHSIVWRDTKKSNLTLFTTNANHQLLSNAEGYP